MKTAKFETYKSKPNEFKIAQSRTNPSYNKNYIPAPHPFLERLEGFRAIQSLWTPSKPAGVKK
jgi:hypothetical protein